MPLLTPLAACAIGISSMALICIFMYYHLISIMNKNQKTGKENLIKKEFHSQYNNFEDLYKTLNIYNIPLQSEQEKNKNHER